MQKGGNYLQVLPGDKLPPYETGSVSDNLGADVPTNIRVDVYAAPNGDGYQITDTDTDGTIYSVGYGPEAQDRTYIISPPAAPVASSTPQVSTENASTTSSTPAPAVLGASTTTPSDSTTPSNTSTTTGTTVASTTTIAVPSES